MNNNSGFDYVENHSTEELKAMIRKDDATEGGTHPTLTVTVPVSIALCPTTKCTSQCS